MEFSRIVLRNYSVEPTCLLGRSPTKAESLEFPFSKEVQRDASAKTLAGDSRDRQCHHRMNLPNSVVGHVFATVALIFRCMAYVPLRFADHCNDRRLSKGQLLSSASVRNWLWCTRKQHNPQQQHRIGRNAGVNLTSGSSNIDIGNVGVAGESKIIRIGKQGLQTNTYIAGISGVTVPTGVRVIVDANGHLGTIVSSVRFKEDIKADGQSERSDSQAETGDLSLQA